VVLADGTRVPGTTVRIKTGSYVIVADASGRKEAFAWSQLREVNGNPVLAAPTMKEGLTVEGTGLVFNTRLDAAEAKRQDWKKRGGSLATFDVHLNATGILFPQKEFPAGSPCIDSSGQIRTKTESSPYQNGGGGGGIGGRLGYMFLALPSDGRGPWAAFKLGTGVDVGFMAMQMAMNPGCPGTGVDFMTSAFTTVQVPFQAGLHVGLGGGSGDHWKGVVLGFNYSPSYSYAVMTSGDASSGSGSFNAAGFELNIDFTSLEATLDKLTQEAHFRITAFVLPPITADLPWVGVFGLGAVWY
jgi:hypothetical protein